MASITAAQAAQKWQTRLSGATEEIKQGVAAVTVAPGQAAAKQKAVWLAQVTASADKWARNVAAVSLADWQQKMTTVGVPRIAQGAQANQPKVEQFLNQFLPYLEAGKAKIAAMPKGGLENGIARATAQIRYNAAFQRNKAA